MENEKEIEIELKIESVIKYKATVATKQGACVSSVYDSEDEAKAYLNRNLSKEWCIPMLKTITIKQVK